MKVMDAIMLAVNKIKAWVKAGGVNWNDLTDKPFGKTTVPSDTLTWDGNTEGLVSAMDIFYKVSNAVFTLDELSGAVLEFSDGAAVSAADEGALVEFADGVLLFAELCFIVADSAIGVDFGDGLIFSEAGVYFANIDGLYSSSLTIPGYSGFTKTEVKTIEPEYLPGAVVLYVDESLNLYNTADVSDPANLTTKAELAEIVNSGRKLIVTMNGQMLFMAVAINMVNSYGTIEIIVNEGEGLFTLYECRTAEYTAE